MFSELFRAAKKSNKGSWFFAFLLFFAEVLTAAFFFVLLFKTARRELFEKYRLMFLTFLFSAMFLILCVFRAANVRFFLKNAEPREKTTVKGFFGSVFLETLLSLIKAAAFFVCFFPSAAMAFSLFVFSQNGMPLTAAAVLFAFLAAMLYVSAFFFSRIVSAFFLVPYVYALAPSLGVFGAIREGLSKNRGMIKSLNRLKRCFFGYMLLNLFVFPIPFVWAFRKRLLAFFAYGLI